MNPEALIAAALGEQVHIGPASFYDTMPKKKVVPKPVVVKPVPEIRVLPEVEVGTIVKAVVEAHGITFEDFRKNRAWKYAKARQHAVWMIRKVWPKHSLSSLARICGYSDHSTVVHCLRQFEKDQTRFAREVDAVFKSVGGE